MKKIAEITQRKLKWSQPKALQREFELRADGELVATLKFRSAWGSLAIAESADGCWTFKRVGFWQTKATIRALGSDTDVAVFNNNTWANGGTLVLRDGRKYPATSNFWQTQCQFQTEQGTPLILMKTGGFIHQSADIQIEPAAIAVTDLPWIVMFGMYLVVGMSEDAAAVGGVTACVAAFC